MYEIIAVILAVLSLFGVNAFQKRKADKAKAEADELRVKLEEKERQEKIFKAAQEAKDEQVKKKKKASAEKKKVDAIIDKAETEVGDEKVEAQQSAVDAVNSRFNGRVRNSSKPKPKV